MGPVAGRAFPVVSSSPSRVLRVSLLALLSLLPLLPDRFPFGHAFHESGGILGMGSSQPCQRAVTRKVNPNTTEIRVAGQIESPRDSSADEVDNRGQRGRCHEPLAPHELLGRLAGGDVDEIAPRSRTDHAEEDGAQHRQL